MSKKRKRGAESEATASVADTAHISISSGSDIESGEDEEFAGFSEDDGSHLGLAEDVDEDEEEEANTSEDEEEGETLLDATDVLDHESDSDEQVEEEVAAISKVLSKAKKQNRSA